MPVTFCGGTRYMFERQQVAMAYVRKFGRLDLFIKVTTNPKWPEILESLTRGYQPHDRPDLLVIVFSLKIQKLLKILKDECFSCLEAWLYNIEFQKRHLLHACKSQNPSFISITFLPLYFRTLSQNESEVGHPR